MVWCSMVIGHVGCEKSPQQVFTAPSLPTTSINFLEGLPPSNL